MAVVPVLNVLVCISPKVELDDQHPPCQSLQGPHRLGLPGLYGPDGRQSPWHPWPLRPRWALIALAPLASAAPIALAPQPGAQVPQVSMGPNRLGPPGLRGAGEAGNEAVQVAGAFHVMASLIHRLYSHTNQPMHMGLKFS